MKLSSLLSQRPALLQQMRLANLAFAYDRLREFDRRIMRAQLRGEVRLREAAPGAERFWATLTALHGRQSVIEEHFSDEDIMDLADVIAYATGETDVDLRFRIEELADRFLAPVRDRLVQAGIVIDRPERNPDPESATGDSRGCSRADEAG